VSQETDHPKAAPRTSLEEGIAEWRSYLRRRQAIHSVDADELEDHLRSQASALVSLIPTCNHETSKPKASFPSTSSVVRAATW